MFKYIIRRICMCIVVVVVSAIVIFTIMSFVPGDPAQIILGTEASQAMLEAKREELGLNGPYLYRLGKFLYNVFIKFDFGVSYTYNVPVMGELLSRLPRTFILGFTCVIVDVVIALPLGIWAALHQGKIQDKISTLISMFCVSVPSFWFALMLIVVFSLKLNWLPSFGVGGIKYYILPVMAGALGGIGNIARQMRSGMLDVINSDFIVTARAKGVPEKDVIMKHILPNSLIPVITVIGGNFSRCIAGTVIIEQIFSFPGVGQYMLSAVNSRDYPVVQGVVIILAAATSIIMLVVDLIYAVVDPRIKSRYSKG